MAIDCTIKHGSTGLGGQNQPRFKPVVLTGYNRPCQYSLKWSLLVSILQSGRLEILGGCVCVFLWWTDIFGQVLKYVLYRKQKTF